MKSSIHSMTSLISGLAFAVVVLTSVPSLCFESDQSSMPPTETSSAHVPTSLNVQELVQKMEARNLDRANAVREYQGVRTYTMQYRGFPGNRDAEMVVTMSYRAPDTKKFTVISQSGSKFIIDRVFKKLLEGEQEAGNEENRRRTALTSANYDFEMVGFEENETGSVYVLSVTPKEKTKFVYKGKIWVDARDFAVTRIDAEPAKNPSFWIKKTAIEHKYAKVNDFWFPAQDHTESQIRLGGRAILDIEYRDYKILRAGPVNQVKGSGSTPAHVPHVQSQTGPIILGRLHDSLVEPRLIGE